MWLREHIQKKIKSISGSVEKVNLNKRGINNNYKINMLIKESKKIYIQKLTILSAKSLVYQYSTPLEYYKKY